jgi:hypothetical protein
MPASSIVRSEPSPLITFKSANPVSLELIIPSLLESSSASVSKVNNSEPLSTMPFWFLSRVSTASSELTHAVFSAKPELSKSKYTPLFVETSSTPSLSRSKIMGSSGYACFH